MVFWVLWLPLRLQASLPSSAQTCLDRGDTSALLILFLGVPLALGAAAFLSVLTLALLLRFVFSRSEAQRFILASPSGGHVGRVERLILRLFKEDSGVAPNNRWRV